MRGLLNGTDGFDGQFYSTSGVVLEPGPAQPTGPPIWIGSWGSRAGLRRVVRVGDGWLASAYNIGPNRFGECFDQLSELRRAAGGVPDPYPNALATTWLYVDDDQRAADRIYTDVLAPMLGRTPEELRSLALPIGPAQVCAERLTAYARAGVQRLFVWPVRDEVRQLELFRERVVPLIPADG